MICKHIKLLCKTPELIENYNEAINDTTQMWDCHHRLETHFSDGTKRNEDDFLSGKELQDQNLYFHRPPEELIFLTKSEHRTLHNKDTKYRNKISETNKIKLKGENNGFYGKHHSQETLDKIADFNRNRHWFNNGTQEVFEYECPEGFISGRLCSNKDKHWFNNGKESILAYECPDGYILGKLDINNELKDKMKSLWTDDKRKKQSEIMKGKCKGKRWFNNGEICVRAKECPEGFVPGRLKK